MANTAWAEDTGYLPSLIVVAVAAGTPGNRVYLAVRDSFYLAVSKMFADPRCDENTKQLVREYLSGEPDAVRG